MESTAVSRANDVAGGPSQDRKGEMARRNQLPGQSRTRWTRDYCGAADAAMQA
jgi:hypothetical protein